MEKGLKQSEAWYPWLERELKKREHKLLTLEFSQGEEISECIERGRDFNKYLDGNSMIVGHGFGVKVALQILQNKSRTIAAAFLVAGHLDDSQFDFANIKEKAREFFVYAGEDDNTVPPENTEGLAELLDEDVLHIAEAGHFDRITEFEDLLIDIISVLDQ